MSLDFSLANQSGIFGLKLSGECVFSVCLTNFRGWHFLIARSLDHERSNSASEII